MGKRCDYRSLARDLASGDQQRRLVNELLTGHLVPRVQDELGGFRIGVAGVRSGRWGDLSERLESVGFRFTTEVRNTETGEPRMFYRMLFPVEDD